MRALVGLARALQGLGEKPALIELKLYDTKMGGMGVEAFNDVCSSSESRLSSLNVALNPELTESHKQRLRVVRDAGEH